MSTRYRSTAAKVRKAKERHPENFCKVPKCLWRVDSGCREDGYCPRHRYLGPNPVPPAPWAKATA